MTLLGAVEEVARVDGAAGWCLSIGAVHGALGAYLREDVARAIYCDDPRTVVAGSVNASGVARAVDGGYRISGRWTFASGIHHSAWVYGNCVVHDGDTPRRGQGDAPEMRFAFFPVDQCEIHDTWHVSGLRGTGSHDFSVADLFVPEERSLVAFTAKPYQPGPLYTCPFVTYFAASIAGPPLGIARGAIDALVELASTKTPTGSQSLLRDRPSVQSDIARAEALVRSGAGLPGRGAPGHLGSADRRPRGHDAAARDGPDRRDQRRDERGSRCISGSAWGLGDINPSLFFSPAKPGAVIWGVGPTLTIPTATDSKLGSGKFSLGPTAVALTIQGPWVFGALINNQWSVAGWGDKDVNQMLLQPFVNFNLPQGWYLTSSPIMTANWEAASGGKWTVPVGGGVGKLLRTGGSASRSSSCSRPSSSVCTHGCPLRPRRCHVQGLTIPPSLLQRAEQVSQLAACCRAHGPAEPGSFVLGRRTKVPWRGPSGI